MDRYYSSAISKESSDIYSIPNSTQHDARQRCPALIVLKEENNNNNSTVALVNVLRPKSWKSEVVKNVVIRYGLEVRHFMRVCLCFEGCLVVSFGVKILTSC